MSEEAPEEPSSSMSLDDSIQLPGGLEPPKRRRMSWRMFGYLLREFSGVFFLCACAFLMLFLIETLFDDLPDFLKNNGSLALAARYFVLLQPQRFVLVMPMAVLLASMYTISSLCRYNELTALSASGQSLFRVCMPIWLSVMVLAGIQFVAAEYIAPEWGQRAEGILTRLKDPKGLRAKVEGNYLAYRNKAEQRVWLFEHFEPNGVSRGVIVTSFRDDGTAKEEMRAQSVRYEGYWLFENVTITAFDKSGQLPEGEVAVVDVMPKREFGENPRSLQYRFHLRPAGLMSISELRRALDARGETLPAAAAATFRTQLWARWTAPFACLVAALLGVPLAVVRERKAPVWSFVSAAGLMGAFYLVTQIMLGLARSGMVPAAIAAFTSVIVFSALGGWLIHKRR